MSTRCRIGLQKPNGKIESVVCYKDGYPEYVGEMLAEHYSDIETITRLIAGGDIFGLEKTTETTIYEHRDRGVEWDEAKPVIYNGLGNYLNATDEMDYIYIFINGRWAVDELQ